MITVNTKFFFFISIIESNKKKKAFSQDITIAKFSHIRHGKYTKKNNLILKRELIQFMFFFFFFNFASDKKQTAKNGIFFYLSTAPIVLPTEVAC